MKVSVNVAPAKSTEKHNDRSMYRYESPSEFEKAEHGHNLHWDCYNIGSSVKSEKMFYQEFFHNILDETNKAYERNYHPERCMDMDTYHKKHMPKEMIVQLGNLEEQPSEEKCIEYLSLARKKLCEVFEKSNIKPISADIHLDEATPHMHMRFIGIDDKGKPNMSGALESAGYSTPLRNACMQNGLKIDVSSKEKILNNYDKLKDIVPDLFYISEKDGKLKFKVRSNTYLNTLTNNVLRPLMEDLARELGHKINTIREKRSIVYENVHEYGYNKDIKKETKGLDKLINEAEEKANTLLTTAKAKKEYADEYLIKEMQAKQGKLKDLDEQIQSKQGELEDINKKFQSKQGELQEKCDGIEQRVGKLLDQENLVKQRIDIKSKEHSELSHKVDALNNHIGNWLDTSFLGSLIKDLAFSETILKNIVSDFFPGRDIVDIENEYLPNKQQLQDEIYSISKELYHKHPDEIQKIKDSGALQLDYKENKENKEKNRQNGKSGYNGDER